MQFHPLKESIMKKQLLLLSLLFSTLLVQPATGPGELLLLLESIKTTSKTPTTVTAKITSIIGTPPPPPALSRTSSSSSTTSSDGDSDSDSDGSSSSAPATPRPPSTVTVSDDDNYGAAAHWFQTNDDATTQPPAPPTMTGTPVLPTGPTISQERERELLERIRILEKENADLVAALAAARTTAAPGAPPPPPPGGMMPGGPPAPPMLRDKDGNPILPPGMTSLPGGAPAPPRGMMPPGMGGAPPPKAKKKTPTGGSGDLLAAIRAGKKLKSKKRTDKKKPKKKTMLDELKAAKGKAGGKKQRKSAYPKVSDDGNSISFKITKVTDIEKGRISETDAAAYKTMTRFTIEESTKKPKKGSAFQVIKLTLKADKKWPSEFAPLVGASSAATTSGKPLSMAKLMEGKMTERAAALAGESTAKAKGDPEVKKYPRKDSEEVVTFKIGSYTDKEEGLLTEDDAREEASGDWACCSVTITDGEAIFTLDNDCHWTDWMELEAEEDDDD